MAKVKFIGYSRSSMTTRRGEVLNGYDLYVLMKLQKGGVGFYSKKKFITDERLGDMDLPGGLPELNIEYDVEYDDYGNFAEIVPAE